ncbi:hypothetical protein FIBSPDRAFT_944550 [Athelia psychrophila]|uniref:DUF6533 domain-containing protein n=1 Tax=Athelia psychrophila TaxID=1759441 RepID=A0A166UR22_9AGAM|nr:hypothetical protein FIBSPDRAFT_944550 [Fibularhizoctonia sp. CBS 109695]
MSTESVSAFSIQLVRNTAYFDVFSACVLIYDYILTFHLEVNLIWGEPWKSLKILFLLSRYLPFADTTIIFLSFNHSPSSQNGCRVLGLTMGLLFSAGSCITEYIFAVRTWAMWGFDRKIGAVLVTMYLATWVPDIVVTVFYEREAKYLPPTTVAQGCNEASANATLFLGQSGALIVYWLILIGLMVAKGGSPWKPLFRDSLFNVLYRDALVILNMIATTWPHARINLLYFFQRVMHSVLTNHLLFNLRRYGRKTARWDLGEVTSGSRPPFGSLVFEHELQTWVGGQSTGDETNA